MTSSATARRDAGFTLLEILLAVTIVVLVLGSIYGVFTGISRARDRVETRGAAGHQARVVFDRIGRELRSAYPLARTGGAFTGDNGTGSILPALSFATTAGTPAGGAHGGIRLVRYALARVPEGETGGYELLRSETPAFLGAATPEQASRLIAGVSALRWRFYGDGSWQDEWPASAGRLPQAVEMTLTLQAGTETLPFVSSFEVPLAAVTP
jgi:general secretion pathway protein J